MAAGRPLLRDLFCTFTAAGALVAPGLVALAPPAAAVAVHESSAAPTYSRTAAVAVPRDEVFERPTDGIFPVRGHGWGHGRGMSQWGAQGAALAGEDATAIVSRYYPGTAAGTAPNNPMRVRLDGDEGRDLQVSPLPGLTVTDAATGKSLLLPAGPDRWRVLGDSTGLHVQGRVGTAWQPQAVGGATTLPGPVRFTETGSGLQRLHFPDGSAREYRGSLSAARSGSGLISIATLPLEEYLLSVVPLEAISSWRPAALQAQAIAARSYSLNKTAHSRSTLYDICDTQSCQVFGGTRRITAAGTTSEVEVASTTAAVAATKGAVRTYQGQPIFAEFSSANGGWSTDGGIPYLKAQADPWDGLAFDSSTNSVHAWQGVLRAETLERRYPAVGRLDRVRITSRDGNGEWGGRVLGVVLEGTLDGRPTSVTTTGRDVQLSHVWPTSADGLRSPWWTIINSSPVDVKYAALGGASSFMGKPIAAEVATGGGRQRMYEHGRISWTAATGAWEVHGQINTLHQQLRGVRGVLGFPLTDQKPTRGGVGRFNHFAGGTIVTHPNTGTHEVLGAIRTAWLKQGSERGSLGYPITGEYAVTGGRMSDFQGGRIRWDSATGRTTVLLDGQAGGA